MTNEQEELAEKRAAAIKSKQLFTKTRIRSEFKMKPAPGTRPAKTYKNEYGGTSQLYYLTDCIAVKTVEKREPTAKQLINRQITSLRNQLRSDCAQTGELIDNWISKSWLCFDTETTGLDYHDQIIEFAIINDRCETLLNARIKPSVAINSDAEAVHGISQADLQNAPEFPVIYKELKSILLSELVVIFNDDFDLRMLKQTCRAFNLDDEWVDDIQTMCAMNISARAFGPTNRHGTISLSSAMRCAQKQFVGAAHSALADVIATHDVVRAIHDVYVKTQAELIEKQNELDAMK